MSLLDDLGYNDFLQRTPVTSALSSSTLSKQDIDAIFSNRSISYSSTSLSNLTPGENMQSADFITGVSGWCIRGAGDVEFNDGYFRGSLTAGEIHIPDKTTTTQSFHTNLTGDSWWGCTETSFDANHDNATAYVLNTGIAKFQNITITAGAVSTSTLDGLIAQANLNVADRGWSQTCVFSVTDADTIAWADGTFTSADGTAYNIGAGNTGNMVAKTYIYLDTAVSTIAYQTTTTPATAIGIGKVLIATAQNGTYEATFTELQGGGINIDASSIAANSITANEIAAQTITAAKLSATLLYAGSLEIDAAGNVRGGQTNYETGNGFWIGYHLTDYKFSIGDADNFMKWDGSYLRVKGSVDIGTNGLMNNASYTVANLPSSIASEGFNFPSAYE